MKKLTVLALSYFLFACSGEVDNTEPPAPLVEFTPTAEISVSDETVIGKGIAGQYLKLQPVVSDSKLIVTGRHGRITAFDVSTGKITWINEFDTTISSDLGADEQMAVMGSRDGDVIAFSLADGTEIWRKRVTSEVIAHPAFTSDAVLVRSIDGQVTALDKKNGQQKWFFKRDVPALTLRGNSAPLVIDDHVFIGMDDGRMIVLDARNGNQVWDKTVAIPKGRSELDRLVDLDADALQDNNVLYIAGYQGNLTSFDLVTGEYNWRREMSVVNDMVLSANTLFVVDVRSHIWALDKNTGATIWKQEVFNARKLTAPVIMGENLVVADDQGYVHMIATSDGHQVARVQVEETGIITTPVVTGDLLNVISRSGTLYNLTVKQLN